MSTRAARRGREGIDDRVFKTPGAPCEEKADPIAVMFTPRDNAGYKESLRGIRQKTLAYGEKTLMVEFRLREGAVLPQHKHPHEQIGYLVSGRLKLTIGGETREQRSGDSWCIPGNTEHGAAALEDSVAVEVFAPVRDDYLPHRG